MLPGQKRCVYLKASSFNALEEMCKDTHCCRSVLTQKAILAYYDAFKEYKKQKGAEAKHE